MISNSLNNSKMVMAMKGIVMTCIILFMYSCQMTKEDKEPDKNASERTEAKGVQETSTIDLPTIDQFNTEVTYVPSVGEGNVSAIDLKNNRIKWTVQISEGNDERGPESAMGIASTPDGKWVFSGDVVRNEAVIIDAEEQTIAKRIPLSHGVHAIDIDPYGKWVWVSGRLPDFPWLTAVTIIDAVKKEKVSTLSPGLGGAAHYAWTPDAKEVWAASISTNTVWVWDADKRKILDVIPLIYEDLALKSPEASLGLIGLNEIAITPDGKKAFAVGPEAGVVFSIDVKDRKMIKSVKVGERTHGVSISRDGKEVWTANNTGTVTILDVSNLNILDEIDLSEFAEELPYSHIAFSLDGKKAYVSIEKDVAVINVNTRKVITTIPFGYGTHENSLEDFYVVPPKPGHKVAETGVNASDNQEQDNLTKTSNRAGINISVTYREEQPGQLSFHLSINTHSGDLMENDIANQASVRINNVNEIRTGFSWNPESESSHHRKGVLTVKHQASSIKSVELELRDIGVPSRIFKWELMS